MTGTMKFKLNRYTPLLEDSNGGQKTFKLFLAELMEEFLDIKINVDEWHLHHINGKHFDNKRDNLALVLVKDHRILHGKVKGRDKPDYGERLTRAFENMEWHEGPIYVDECLKHIINNLERRLEKEADSDEKSIMSNKNEDCRK